MSEIKDFSKEFSSKKEEYINKHKQLLQTLQLLEGQYGVEIQKIKDIIKQKDRQTSNAIDMAGVAIKSYKETASQSPVVLQREKDELARISNALLSEVVKGTFADIETLLHLRMAIEYSLAVLQGKESQNIPLDTWQEDIAGFEKQVQELTALLGQFKEFLDKEKQIE